jgi:hypothetical protein
MTMRDTYDVIVLGGGPGGTMAAAAAATRGASVLLVERYGFLGGMATAGLVNPFMWYFHDGKPLTTAAFNELLDRLDRAGGLAKDRLTFDDEIMKIVLDRMMADRGVAVSLHTWFTGLDLAGRRIEAVRLAGKSGPRTVRGKVFVDSTGDGDVAVAAGAPVETGRPADGGCQPMTLCFRLGGIEIPEGWEAGWDAMHAELDAVYQAARSRGEVGNPREDVLIFRTTVPGIVHFNTTRVVGKSGVDTQALGEAEAEGRRQVLELLDLLRAKSPRCRNAWLVKMAPQIGIRETRRVLGAYILTEADVLSAAKFEDGIARSNYPVDIHNPAGTGTVIRDVPKGDYYEIPYRCLVPRNTDNLLVGSRCISATHEAHSSLRIMPVVAGLGEAAGTAAAACAGSGTAPAAVDGRALKREMLG